ncbi:MAG: energy transducer TonB [Acidobacteriota bacterium]
MPRDLFRDVVSPHVRVGGRQWYAVPLSMLIHAVIILAMVIVPVLAPAVVPLPQSMLTWLWAAPLPPPEVPQAPAARPPARKSFADLNPAAPPLEAPRGIRDEPGLVVDPEPAAGVEGGLAAVIEGAGTRGLPEALPLPAPVAPLRMHAGLRAPTKIRDVAPVYPAIARAAHVQGVVILEAVIGSDGRIAQARVLRSIPLLDQAALDAVRQWEFTPTLLNGIPVPIVMTVTVVFALK